jgi:hypothetical protein
MPSEISPLPEEKPDTQAKLITDRAAVQQFAKKKCDRLRNSSKLEPGQLPTSRHPALIPFRSFGLSGFRDLSGD